MPAAVLLCLLGGCPAQTPRAPCCPYPQLPPELICELCYQQCEADRHAISLQLELVGGWQRRQLLGLKCEADRLAATWYAAWWVTWSRATPEQQDEWAEILISFTGADAFWRGEVPLPLSLR